MEEKSSTAPSLPPSSISLSSRALSTSSSSCPPSTCSRSSTRRQPKLHPPPGPTNAFPDIPIRSQTLCSAQPPPNPPTHPERREMTSFRPLASLLPLAVLAALSQQPAPFAVRPPRTAAPATPRPASPRLHPPWPCGTPNSLAVPDPRLAQQHLKALTAAPHWASSPEDYATAQYVAAQFKAAGLQTEILRQACLPTSSSVLHRGLRRRWPQDLHWLH